MACMACMREAAGFTAHSRVFVFTCLLRRAPCRRYCRNACVQILLAFRPRVFGAHKFGLMRMFLLDTSKSRQAAAWQVRNECQCVVVDRHFPPGFDREPGDAYDIVARLARQTRATLQPFDDAMRAGIVGGCDKAEIAKLQAESLQKASRGGNRLHGIERICKPGFCRYLWHELGDPERALFANLMLV